MHPTGAGYRSRGGRLHARRHERYLDVIVPRGGKTLVERVQKEARVPVIGHLEGNCHVYIDRDADVRMARTIALTPRCGAPASAAPPNAAGRPRLRGTHLGPVVRDLLDAGCEVRGDATVLEVDPRVRPASEDDWYTEYLDAIIAARVVEAWMRPSRTSRATAPRTPNRSSPRTAPRRALPAARRQRHRAA